MKSKLIATALLVLAVTGCGPSERQVSCENAGGDWESETTYQYGYSTTTGKYEPVLVTSYYCDLP